MKNIKNDKEKEKLKEINPNFIHLDESLTDSNKQSKFLDTDKGKLDFNIQFNKDDIIIENNNNLDKKEIKAPNDINKIMNQNKFDKKIEKSRKVETKEAFNILHNNNHDKNSHVQNIKNKLEISNKPQDINYDSNEKMTRGNKNSGVKKYDISFNELKYDTLDESVCDTIKRDFWRIVYKLECVLLPRFKAEKHKQIHNWDLWGPLVFCLMLCTTISFSSDDSNTGEVFVLLFAIIWVGGIIITLNSKFLGANTTIFQTLCLLGYCIFPINVAALIVRLVSSEAFVKIIVVGVAYVCFCWFHERPSPRRKENDCSISYIFILSFYFLVCFNAVMSQNKFPSVYLIMGFFYLFTTFKDFQEQEKDVCC